MYKINIQMFDDVINVTTANTTGNDLSAEMKTFYEKELLRNAEPNLVHSQFAKKKNIPKGAGKTIEFRRFTSLPKVLTQLTEGVTPDGQSLDVQKITAALGQYGGYVRYSDLLSMTTIDPVIVEATRLLGNQGGLSLDTIVRNVLVAGENVLYAPKTGTSGKEEVESRTALGTDSTLNVDLIERAVAIFEANNVPKINGDYVMIIHPFVAYDLRRDKDWIDAHKYSATKELFRNEIGTIAGVRFVTSSEAKIWNDSTCPTITAAASGNPAVYNPVYACLMLGAEAYADTELTGAGLEMIVKQLGSAGTADPLNQRGTIGWKATKTAKILNEEWIMRIEVVSKAQSKVDAN